LQQRVKSTTSMACGVSEGRSRISTLTARLAFRRRQCDMHGIMWARAPRMPAMACAAILGKSAMAAPVVDDLESVVGRGQRGHHIGGGPWAGRPAPLAEWDGPQASQPFGIDVGDGAGSGRFPCRPRMSCALTGGTRLHGGFSGCRGLGRLPGLHFAGTRLDFARLHWPFLRRRPLPGWFPAICFCHRLMASGRNPLMNQRRFHHLEVHLRGRLDIA